MWALKQALQQVMPRSVLKYLRETLTIDEKHEPSHLQNQLQLQNILWFLRAKRGLLG